MHSRHWELGAQYVVEGGKSLFLLNGAAAAGLLTFVGNNPPNSFQIFRAIYMFAGGSLVAAAFFVFAYLAQLHYGNSALATDQRLADKHHCTATLWHRVGYYLAAGSLGLFIWGVCTAGQGLSHQFGPKTVSVDCRR